jgi:hypothetical protein
LACRAWACARAFGEGLDGGRRGMRGGVEGWPCHPQAIHTYHLHHTTRSQHSHNTATTKRS